MRFVFHIILMSAACETDNPFLAASNMGNGRKKIFRTGIEALCTLCHLCDFQRLIQAIMDWTWDMASVNSHPVI
jgi:hypothetical protein